MGRSCSLCNISHAGLGEKSEFETLRKNLGVKTVHLDEQSDDLAKFLQENALESSRKGLGSCC